MHFDYYYGVEAGQFAFFRIPQLLVKDRRFKCLSTDAKLLYGLMLDRMTLSMKNGWLDAQNRAYIYYSMESIIPEAVRTLSPMAMALKSCAFFFCSLRCGTTMIKYMTTSIPIMMNQ